MLFIHEVLGRDLLDVLAEEEQRALTEPDREASWRYARTIVEGYHEHRRDINHEIQATAEGWPIDRMPRVDLAILRIAVWELRYNDEVPLEVAIAEANALAGQYSTDDSVRFISGVLGTIGDAVKAQPAAGVAEQDAEPAASG